MKWLIVLYETVWFRIHPFTGPVAPDDPMKPIYLSWKEAFELARNCVIDWQRL